jgi:hypothetical protein
MTTGRPKLGTVVTAWLAVGGTLAFVAAIALALVSGCGPAVTPAVTLRVERAPSTPKDASVTIDEQYVGPLAVVAARGVRLPIGEHRISVEKSGYFPYDARVTSDRDDVLLKVKLEPVPD